MRSYRCQCGQPLALIATGLPGTPLQVNEETAAGPVADALRRHLPHCPYVARTARAS
jgi:hypothetical protein